MNLYLLWRSNKTKFNICLHTIAWPTNLFNFDLTIKIIFHSKLIVKVTFHNSEVLFTSPTNVHTRYLSFSFSYVFWINLKRWFAFLLLLLELFYSHFANSCYIHKINIIYSNPNKFVVIHKKPAQFKWIYRLSWIKRMKLITSSLSTKG